MRKRPKRFPTTPLKLHRTLVISVIVLQCLAVSTVPNAYSQARILDDSPPPTLMDIEFLNRRLGWLVGRIGIFSSTNGGKTWLRVGPGLAVTETVTSFLLRILTPVSRVYFVDEKTGWVQRLDGLLKTEDGGKNWALVTAWKEPARQAFTDFSFFDDKSGWALSLDQSVSHTSDGGRSWVKQTQFVGGNALKAASKNECWIVGDRGKILRTSDVGNTWTASSVGTIEDLSDIVLIGARNAWAISSKAIYASEDFGKNWQPLVRAPSNSPIFRSIRFASRLKGWVVADNGRILHTSDGGRTWSNQKSGTKENLKRISVVDQNTAWVIGDSVLLRTSDGGRTWVRQKLPNRIVRN